MLHLASRDAPNKQCGRIGYAVRGDGYKGRVHTPLHEIFVRALCFSRRENSVIERTAYLENLT